MTNPAVDIITDRVAVILQERPVVPFTSWVSDTLRTCTRTERGLQVMTPAAARITMPLRLMLDGPHSRWVARDLPSGTYYDGLSGAVLHWDGAAFVPTEDEQGARTMAAPFIRGEPARDDQLVFTFRVRHPATTTTVLGGALELLCAELTGAPPAGWGTAEPVAWSWRRDELTEFARRRAPQPTWLVTVGGSGERSMLATLQASRSTHGVEESVTLAAGYPYGDDPPLAALPDMLGRMAGEHALLSMLVQLRPGRADLTFPAQWEGLPAPVGVVAGPEGVRENGLDHALNPPGYTAHRIGPAARPTVWYPLGKGRSPDAWRDFEQLIRYLREPRQ